MSNLQVQQSEVLLPITKDSRGGHRDGAGRKPGSETSRRASADEMLRVITAQEEREQWRELLNDVRTKPELRLKVLQAVSELRRGRPGVNQRQVKQQANDPRLLVAIQNLIPGSKRSTLDADQAQITSKSRANRRKKTADNSE